MTRATLGGRKNIFKSLFCFWFCNNPSGNDFKSTHIVDTQLAGKVPNTEKTTCFQRKTSPAKSKLVLSIKLLTQIPLTSNNSMIVKVLSLKDTIDYVVHHRV
jgi:hypothetical protein